MTVKPDVRSMTATHFEPLIGQDFIFQVPAGESSPAGPATTLELLEVSQGRKLGSGRIPFALLFRLKSGPRLADVLHRIVHEQFTPDLLYLSPVVPPLDRDPREMYYEAVFN